MNNSLINEALTDIEVPVSDHCSSLEICPAPNLHLFITYNLKLIKYSITFNFYRTQVNLGSDLWVRMSVSDSERFVKLNFS